LPPLIFDERREHGQDLSDYLLAIVAEAHRGSTGAP
jgi:hypothetical protein